MTRHVIEYELWDVFAAEALRGNPLAVVPDASALQPSMMQALAREFNLSETAFVVPSSRADARARYFTPVTELLMAGHPTIGTAFALEARGRIEGDSATLELGIGVVRVGLEREGGRLARAWMDQGRPRRLSGAGPRSDLATALGLHGDEIAPDLPIETASAGSAFLMVPLRDASALARVRPDAAALRPYLPVEHPSVLVFTLDSDDSLTRCRKFGVTAGIVEDPATGSAHGPLGAYLAWHGVIDPTPGPVSFLSRQGVEMGRPSEIQVRVRLEEGEPVVEVGGAAVRIGEGALRL